MVSFWPFKSGDASASAFEKELSQLSSKLSKASASNDNLRQHQRRFKVLWTLYSSFAYILVALILTLVTGWDKWGAIEYSAVAGGPVLIYGVRTVLDAYYNYRLSNSQSHLNELYKQREATIERLKNATKYNSTQQLLEKYGGTPGKSQASQQPGKKRQPQGGAGSNQTTPQGGRTGFVPPPTANIPGRQPTLGPPPPGLEPPRPQGMPPGIEPGEEFAPNAFSAPSRLDMPRQPSAASQYVTDGPKWYDRILDVVLGEDETQARNRIALICHNCRLVNGQAPPGCRTLEDVGTWRCSACHTMNGVESEEKKMLKQISGEPSSPASPAVPTNAVTDGGRPEELEDESFEKVEEDAGVDGEDKALEASSAPGASTRSKARQRKKA